jgi:hypothetical protein
MLNNDFIHRAFELADTGEFRAVSQIRTVLAREGFSLRQLFQLSGKEIAGKLKVRIAAARALKAKL